MDQIESVTLTTGGRSRWKVKAPPGLAVEFDAKIVNDIPNELIRWSSVDSENVDSTGTVRFKTAPGNRGTVVTLEMEYKPRGGRFGAKIAKMFSVVPKTQLKNDLRRFKQLIEIGEVVKSDSTAVPGMHPAQPPSRKEMEARS